MNALERRANIMERFGLFAYADRLREKGKCARIETIKRFFRLALNKGK